VRILTAGNMYPPHHLGGYELVWQSAVRSLRAQGHQVRVLTTDATLPSPSEPEDDDVHRELRWWWRDHAFPRFSPAARVAVERHNARVLARHLEELRPDVVAWWSMGGMSLSLIERVRRAGPPAVAFVHDDWLVYGPHTDAWLRPLAARAWLRPLAERVLGLPASVDLDHAARYVFVSESTRLRAIEGGRNPADWSVAHSGIDPAFLDPRPERDWGWRLLYVGRVDLRKGIGTALDALAQLPAEATLTIVGAGDPEAEAALRAQAERLGVTERVVRPGFVGRAQLPNVYEEADVVVFPVVWDEPWGLVPLEAMALGRPVVATGRGGSGEYLRDGENALLFPAGDAAGLTSAVERLADDAALRGRLRAGGLATAPRHTEDVFNDAVKREIEQAASRPPAP
jgi:glycogen(starch) synthase